MDVRVQRGADAASDHHLLVTTMRMKLKAFNDQSSRPQHKFNIQFLRNNDRRSAFNCEVKNRFEALAGMVDTTIEDHWEELQNIWKTTCTHVLGKKKKKQKEWMSPETWALIERRKEPVSRST